MKFTPVKEITSKNASADFQNICRLASNKSAESAVFFRLRGNTAWWWWLSVDCCLDIRRLGKCNQFKYLARTIIMLFQFSIIGVLLSVLIGLALQCSIVSVFENIYSWCQFLSLLLVVPCLLGLWGACAPNFLSNLVHSHRHSWLLTCTELKSVCPVFLVTPVRRKVSNHCMLVTVFSGQRLQKFSYRVW